MAIPYTGTDHGYTVPMVSSPQSHRFIAKRDISSSAVSTKYKTLVFEGGGIKGIAYVGAILELRKKGILQGMQRFSGSSIGSLFALLAVLDVQEEELMSMIEKSSMEKFMAPSFLYMREIWNFVRTWGAFSGSDLEDFVEGILRKHTGRPHCTFLQLQWHTKKELLVPASNLSRNRLELFGPRTHPHHSVAKAIRASMSFPFVFAPTIWNGDYFVDGGLVLNDPIFLFQLEEHANCRDATHTGSTSLKGRSGASSVLGLRLEEHGRLAKLQGRNTEEERFAITGFFEYASAVVRTMMDALDGVLANTTKGRDTIFVETNGVGTLETELPANKKAELVRSGVLAVQGKFP